MKEKILKQLREKHAGALKDATKEVQELIADKLAAKVTEESQIEGVIDELDKGPIPFADYVSMMTAEADRRVSGARQSLDHKYDLIPKGTKKKDEPAGDKKDDASSDDRLAAAIAKALEPITKQFSTLQTQSKRDQLNARLKEKNIPEAIAANISIDDDFDVDKAVSSAETQWNNLRQLAVNSAVEKGQVSRAQSTEINEQVIKDFAASAAPSKETGYNIIEV